MIRGFGGDDVIRANPGDRPPAYYGRVDHDDVDGGTGNDVIYGGRGLDVLRGGRGRDRIYGGRGADRIVGGPGADVIDAGPYHDRIRADDGRGTSFAAARAPTGWLPIVPTSSSTASE